MNEAMKKPSSDYKSNNSHDGSVDAAINTSSWNASRPDADKRKGEDATPPGAQLAVQTIDLTSQMARSAQGLVKAEVGRQTGKGATDLSEIAKVFRQTSKDLPNNMAAIYVEKAADQIDRASKFLQTADPKDVIRSIERFAKREPLLFLGGAFAVGLLTARFMKSSAAGHATSGDKSKKSNFNGSQKGNSNGSKVDRSLQAYGNARS